MRLGFSKKKAAQRLRRLAPIAVPHMSDADMAAVYHGERVGGDLYDFLRVNPQRVLFGLLDVAGRREENAAIVSAAQHTFRTMGKKLLTDDDINESDAMLELSLQVNRAIMDSAGGVRSCPAFVGCFNETLGTVCYSNAGHTPALLRDQNGITRLEATGLPFGLFSHVTHDAPTVALPPGAALLLVSRGVTEGKCNAEEFGLERVERVFSQAATTAAEQLCGQILDAVEQFMCKPPSNDVTALVLIRGPAGNPDSTRVPPRTTAAQPS